MKKTKSTIFGIFIASLMYVAASLANALVQALILYFAGATSLQDLFEAYSGGIVFYIVLLYVFSAVFHVLGGRFTVNILKNKYMGKGILTAKYFRTISWTIFILWSLLGGLFSSRSGWVGAIFQSLAISRFSSKFIEAEAAEAGDISSVVMGASHREDAPCAEEVVVDKAPEASQGENASQKMESPKAMYCRKCGKKLVEGSAFCAYCGTKVAEITAKNELIPSPKAGIKKGFRTFANYDVNSNTANVETAAVDYDEFETSYLTKLTELCQNKQFAEVITYGEELLKKYQIPTEAENGYLYCFESYVKFMLYLAIHKDELKKNLVWNAERVSEILYTMGSSSIELGDMKAAEKYLAEAAAMDPTNVRIHCEYAYCLVGQEKHNEAEKLLKDVFQYCSSFDEFARLYRMLGSIYIKKNLIDLAEASYLWSTRFEGSDAAINELLYIEQELKGHDEEQQKESIRKLSRNEYLKMVLDVNGVPFTVKRKTFEVLQSVPEEDYKKLCAKFAELDIVGQEDK